MIFISHFEKFHFYPCFLYIFRVSKISRFAFKLRKIQIIPKKYSKHVENNYGIFWGITQKAPIEAFDKQKALEVVYGEQEALIKAYIEQKTHEKV